MGSLCEQAYGRNERDMPRIYIVIATFLPNVGGAEKQALAHGRSLREKDFAATILTLRHKRQWARREEIEGVPVIRVGGMVLGDRERMPAPLRKLLYLMGLLIMIWTLWSQRRNYDVLHLYQLGLLALPVAFVCKLTRKPLLISVRAANAAEVEKSQTSLVVGPLDAHTSWLRVRERTRVSGDLEGLERLGTFAVQYTRLLLKRIHAEVVILSSQMKDYLAAHDFLLPNTHLIPNGVDTTRFAPTTTFRAERAQTVVCVARLAYQKGIDVLLQAWYIVQQEVPQARLIIVGTGPSQEQLTHLTQALQLEKSVEFVGLQHDVQAQLHRAGIAVLPSRCEGMPNAVLEAMACELPCVATRVSGSEDIIQHGVNGLLVGVEDYQGMAQALLILLRDPALVRHYGHVAHTTIVEHFSLEYITDQYIALYQRVLAAKHQRDEKRTESSNNNPSTGLHSGKDAHSCVE